MGESHQNGQKLGKSSVFTLLPEHSFFCTKFCIYSINFLNLGYISLASYFDVRSLMGKISAAFNKQYLVGNFLDKISACFWTARFLGHKECLQQRV